MIERKRVNNIDLALEVYNPMTDDIRAAYGPGKTVKELGQGADVAVNFNFADTAKGVPIGRLIVDGIAVAHDIPKTTKRDELYMLPDGTLHIGKAPAGTLWAVQGSPRLLRDGKNVVGESIQRDQLGKDIWSRRALRTAAGLTPDGKLVVVRTKDEIYLTELADIMAKLGCRDALAGDGGGSCYYWPEDTGWGRKLGSAIVIKKGVEGMRINDIQVSKNFKLYEFECRSTGEVKLDPKLLELAQKLRDKLGKPVKINSAYRTPEHNKAIGGSPNSQHMLGKAIDVALLPGMTIDQLAAVGKSVGFTGIGKYPWGCHFDVRAVRAEWDYRKGGADQ